MRLFGQLIWVKGMLSSPFLGEDLQSCRLEIIQSADCCAMKVIMHPEMFDVILVSNQMGGILA
jgi:hypothetical protein